MKYNKYKDIPVGIASNNEKDLEILGKIKFTSKSAD